MKYLTVYTLSYFTILTIFVYLINSPQIITNDKKGLIREYYIENFINIINFDYFLILIYLGFNYMLIKIFKIESLIGEILINILGTILISGGFMLYFLSRPLNKNSFFSKWFHSVKWRAVVFDIFLILLTFLLIKLIYNRMNN
jgi:hypothetical protein